MTDPNFHGTNMQDQILRPKQAAAILNVSVQTLAMWRYKWRKATPEEQLSMPYLPWSTIGKRSVRYHVSDLHEFIQVAK